MSGLAEAGFRVFKWKVGVGDPADELGLLDELCGRLPPGGRLRLDANGAWERRVAERWLERCAGRPVEFVEQPVAAPPGASARDRARADDLLRGLAGAFPTPLALDESLAGDGDVARWLAEGWPGFYVLKLTLHAAPAATLEALARARARVVFSSALETRVGAAHALRLAWAWSGERHALGFGVWPLFAARALDGPAAAPFLRREDVAALDLEEAWNALA
jgi:O-succinylbenzoate synthase